MFTLGDSELPEDNDSLHTALERCITGMGGKAGGVELDGLYPSFEAIRLNMTGANFPPKFWHTPATNGETRGFSTRLLEITATPAVVNGVQFILTLRSEDCVFVSGAAEDGTRVINSRNCAEGETILTANIEEIGRFLQVTAEKAASAQGAHVQSVNISLDSTGPRAVVMNATATAKAMLFTATLNFEGRLDVGVDHNARFHDLKCKGSGMLATLAANFLRPRLEKIEGKRYPLTRLVPRGNPIRDIVLECNGSFRMRVSFGVKRKS